MNHVRTYFYMTSCNQICWHHSEVSQFESRQKHWL